MAPPTPPVGGMQELSKMHALTVGLSGVFGSVPAHDTARTMGLLLRGMSLMVRTLPLSWAMALGRALGWV